MQDANNNSPIELPKFADVTLTCFDCRKIFTFEKGEQRYFWTKGMPPPKRCPRCRSFRRLSIERVEDRDVQQS